ncbi:cupin domain-containing protein [Microvirga yunnanensis]|uniref:cupin domain-containing protein n=1 Tax=Microvirga yunnanensis TaxID=2953740 RepID=UPI0021C6469C|nr:cupin domain-containing protein [Microvirga sp. HBU65207]
MKATRVITAAVLVVASGLTLQSAQAQQPTNQVMQFSGIGRTDVLQNDLSQPGREVIQTRVDFPHEATAAAHTHPGEEVAYILEGTLEYNLEGRPPVTLNAGEALFIPAGTSHWVRNVGPGKASELATYLVEKGKPLVTFK